MNHILVTGASGYIGEILIQELITSGAKVIGVDLEYPLETSKHVSKQSYFFLKGKFEELKGKLASHIKEKQIKISCVVHLAGKTNVQECHNNPYGAFQSNIELTVQVLEFCRETNIERFIFPSTSLVYDYNNSSVPHIEDSTKKPKTIYAWTKLSAENMIQAYSKNYGLKTVIGRISNIYGGSLKENTVLSEILKQAWSNKEKILVEDGNIIRDFVYVDDVVSAIIFFLDLKEKNKFSIFNISQNVGTSIFNLAKTACQINGLPISAVKSRIHMRDIHNVLILDNTKLKNTGWNPQYSLTDGLRILNNTFKIQ